MSTIEYKRDISRDLVQLAETFPAEVLTGARQVGKTTLLKQLFSSLYYVSLDEPPILIDEVQYAPQLLRHLKDSTKLAFSPRCIKSNPSTRTLLWELSKAAY